MSNSHSRHELDRILRTEQEILHDEHEILERLRPRLSTIKIAFLKGTHMNTFGPVTLTFVGESKNAVVLGFDQFGNPWTGEIPAPVFVSDDTAGSIVTFDPKMGLVTAVANGVANISATLTTAEGVSLGDSETVTVAIPITPPPAPVLSSIKIAFV